MRSAPLTTSSALLAERGDAFAQLNEAQRDAVEHGIAECGAAPAPPLLVIAGAGSGKTLTLAARVARLVLAGADPQRLLLLSFSRRAAQALAARAGRVLREALALPAEGGVPELPWAGTFHGVGARLLREHASALGLPERFTVLDRGDAQDLMGLARESLGLARSRDRFPLPGTCLAVYSRAVNSESSLSEAVQAGFPWCSANIDGLRALFTEYVRLKQAQHLLDYDDLLLHWAQAMADPTMAGRIASRFDHVLVDEYQDTNRLQSRILAGLSPRGRGVTVVGDDAQAIYGFRAADVRNILDFPHRFDPPARVVALERNYRSTQPLLAASNAVMAQASARYAKTMWSELEASDRPALVTLADEAAQARWAADRVLQWREEGIALRRQAVLFRTAHHSAALELELARRRIPFVKFGGLRFLEAAHVKDLISVLRLAHNPRARLAAFRVVQLLPGMGPASARRLLDAMDAANDPAAALQAFRPPAGAREAWTAFIALYAALCGQGDWPAEVDLVARWLAPLLERRYEDAAVRQADLPVLARIAAGFASRERFLTELALDPPEATSAEVADPLRDEDYLILSTIHSAKGQEWTAVQVLNVVDGCMPSDMASGSAAEIDEERRLLYVAMTRARNHLQLLAPQRFHVTQQAGHGDRHVYAAPSRFLPREVAAWFDVLTPCPPAPAGEVDVEAGLRIDVLAAARRAW